ncbi:MAG: CDP-diacylglycerol--glycerol-3-phosphate 3-phosphatidyltransferase [Clostridia bacterium]|nr:CDP-diacylglycerol--glycerol-3-phosphate 3-phosphatidyltransferase [Clostridia bacterium]
MNLPNKLTLLRIALVPVYLVLQAMDARWTAWAALAVFALAALTDLLDGKLARARGQVTNFGKFMDPIADKLLVIPAAVLMVSQGGLVPAWVCIVWVAREFVVSGLRMVAAERGVVIPAGQMGKVKAAAQMAAIMLLTVNLPWLGWLSAAALYLATALTVLSCAQYVWEGRYVLKENGKLKMEN